MTTTKLDFTLDEVDWLPWVETVDLATATLEPIAALEESHAHAKTAPYYRLLVHDVAVLHQRSHLFNAVMYGQKGLPRADRELASVAVSHINGCVYCTSVHGRLFAQLTKQPEIMQHIVEEGVDTDLEPRARTIVDYTAKLTLTPELLVRADLVRLRAAGLSDLEILDLTHVVALFAWANRLLQTLGEPVAKQEVAVR